MMKFSQRQSCAAISDKRGYERTDTVDSICHTAIPPSDTRHSATLTAPAAAPSTTLHTAAIFQHVPQPGGLPHGGGRHIGRVERAIRAACAEEAAGARGQDERPGPREGRGSRHGSC